MAEFEVTITSSSYERDSMSVKTVYAICDVMPPDALAGLIAAIDALDEPTAEQMQLRECADTTLCELLGEQSADELIERFKNGTR